MITLHHLFIEASQLMIDGYIIRKMSFYKDPTRAYIIELRHPINNNQAILLYTFDYKTINFFINNKHVKTLK